MTASLWSDPVAATTAALTPWSDFASATTLAGSSGGGPGGTIPTAWSAAASATTLAVPAAGETYRFQAPTYRTEVPRAISRGPRYKVTKSVSVVRVDGSLRQIQTPAVEQLTAAGEEGEDYFLGGRVYQVSRAVADELTAAGYDVEPV